MTAHDKYIYDFLNKHKDEGDWEIITSPMRSDHTFIRTLRTTNSKSMLTEHNSIIEKVVPVDAVVCGLEIHEALIVHLLKSDCWNSDDDTIVTFYERGYNK